MAILTCLCSRLWWKEELTRLHRASLLKREEGRIFRKVMIPPAHLGWRSAPGWRAARWQDPSHRIP